MTVGRDGSAWLAKFPVSQSHFWPRSGFLSAELQRFKRFSYQQNFFLLHFTNLCFVLRASGSSPGLLLCDSITHVLIDVFITFLYLSKDY